MTAFCIGCQWTPPQHCGKCPCCRPTDEATTPRYRFFRMIHGNRIYLFCRSADTPLRANAALWTEADWLEWGELAGLKREEADDEKIGYCND